MFKRKDKKQNKKTPNRDKDESTKNTGGERTTENGKWDPETLLTQEEAPSPEDVADYNTELLDDQNKSIIWAIIKQLKVGTEVKHLQLPTFVLQPRSLLEKLTDSLVHPQIIMGIRDQPDPEQRFLSVVRFYMSGWHVRPKGVKNPLNPVIGEVFKAHWKLESDTDIHYVAEQLSHHPPHTAFVYYSVPKGFIMNANIAPTYVRFYGNSAESNINGLIKLNVYGKDFDEEHYEFSYPNVYVKGILFGSLHLEIIGKVSIVCKETGYTAEIEFKQKGMFRGKYHAISGTIKKSGETKYTLGGFWDSVVTITNCKTKETTDLFNNQKYTIYNKSLPPKEEMPPNESRRLWQDVVAGMLKGNEEEALDAKRKIEVVQRAEENERKEKNIEWIPKLFKKDGTGYYLYKYWDEIVAQIKEYRKKGSVSSKLKDPFEVFAVSNGGKSEVE